MRIADVIAGTRAWELIEADVMAGLALLPAGCVHVAITSPPYFALRRYDADELLQIGQEPSPAEFVATMVRVFGKEGLWRVLRDDGVLFVNLGDTYAHAGACGGGSPVESRHASGGRLAQRRMTDRAQQEKMKARVPPGMKETDLMNIPHAVAEALRADGWYWRSTLIWNKSAPMPESLQGWGWHRCRRKVKPSEQNHEGQRRNQHNIAAGRNARRVDREGAPLDADRGAVASRATWEPCAGCKKCAATGGYVLRRAAWRPTRSYELVFMLTKSPRYFCDPDSVRNELAEATIERDKYTRVLTDPDEQYAVRHDHETVSNPLGSNMRDVIRLGHEPLSIGLCKVCGRYYDNLNRLPKRKKQPKCACGAQEWVAHYAAFPSTLVEPLLKAATSRAGVCASCGAPHARVYEGSEFYGSYHDHSDDLGRGQHHEPGKKLVGGSYYEEYRPPVSSGWRATCSCGAGVIPALALDPFSGSGTTVLTAQRLGLRAMGIDLSPEYIKLARARIAAADLLFNGFV